MQNVDIKKARIEAEKMVKKMRNLDIDLLDAACKGDINRIKLLVEKGADIHTDGGMEDDYAIRCAAGDGHLELVKYLHEQGLSIENVLIDAVYYNHIEVIKYLVENGADVHADNDGCLIRALFNKNYELVHYLTSKCLKKEKG